MASETSSFPSSTNRKINASVDSHISLAWDRNVGSACSCEVHSTQNLFRAATLNLCLAPTSSLIFKLSTPYAANTLPRDARKVSSSSESSVWLLPDNLVFSSSGLTNTMTSKTCMICNFSAAVLVPLLSSIEYMVRAAFLYRARGCWRSVW
jgi:hypothetical protein